MHSTLTREFLVGAALIWAGSQTFAQVPDGNAPNAPQPNQSTETPTTALPTAPQLLAAAPAPRFYASAEYLFWWMKSAPLPLPIVSSGPGNTDVEGLVSSKADSTYILYGSPWPFGIGGNNKQNFPAFSGTRLSLGGYFDDNQRFGLEGSAFLFEHKSAGFSAASDSTGVPRYHLLAKNAVYYAGTTNFVPAGLEDALPISVDGSIAGHIEITNTLRLWGAGATGFFTFYRSNSLELTAVGGFRYLDLYEAFDLSMTLNGFGIDQGKNYAGQSGTLADHFQTRNQFYGGTLGLRSRYNYGSWSIDASLRVSLGTNHDVLNVAGYFTDANFPFTGQANKGTEGFYAQPANEGRMMQNRFSVVPEVQIKATYAFTSWLRASVGYEYLYMTNVIRPADQIDRNVPVGQTFQQNGGLKGIPDISTIYPTKQFNLRDFYANGLTFSVELRF